jgi:hypothetical protein
MTATPATTTPITPMRLPSASGVITPTILTAARPTAITVRSGSPAASSSALAPGTTGVIADGAMTVGDAAATDTVLATGIAVDMAVAVDTADVELTLAMVDLAADRDTATTAADLL